MGVGAYSSLTLPVTHLEKVHSTLQVVFVIHQRFLTGFPNSFQASEVHHCIDFVLSTHKQLASSSLQHHC